MVEEKEIDGIAIFETHVFHDDERDILWNFTMKKSLNRMF